MFYKNPRLKDDVIKLMLEDIEKYGSFVISGVTCNYGEKIASMYALAVYLSAPIELRMERIKKRSVDKHGERALLGGDVYKNTQNFVEFARTRDLTVIDEWSKTLKCPIIRLDATKPISLNATEIISVYYSL